MWFDTVNDEASKDTCGILKHAWLSNSEIESVSLVEACKRIDAYRVLYRFFQKYEADSGMIK